MPDLDVVAFWCCESVIHDQKEVDSSKGPIPVYWEPAPHGYPYSMWWRCGYPGGGCWPWKKDAECKHTRAAKAKWCGWDTGPGIGDAGEPVEDPETGEDCCPRCGGPVTAQRWGV